MICVRSRRGTQVRGRILTMAAAGALMFYAILIYAYNPFQDQMQFMGSNVTVQAQWPNAVMTWELNPATGTNVTTKNGTDVPTTITTAFTAWNTTLLSGQTHPLTNVQITRGPDTSLTDPDNLDCKNIVSFVPSSSVTFPTGAIAFTEVSTVTLLPGQTDDTSACHDTNTTQGPVSFLIDADMEFNPKDNFSTTTSPLANQFDVQSVAMHEFGHALGLDHSGIAHVMMFPFGDMGEGQQRTLATDDVVGIAYLYPAANFATATGTISGTVALDSKVAFASHVIVVDATSGIPVVDRLTNMDGTYKILGVPPGSYNVLALPLGKDVNSGIFILDDFSGWACGYGEQSPPCCDPTTDKNCTGTALQNPTNYTGKFF